ncbi:nuclease-related domain-containing protein [Bacillus sp. JJ1532]|uniref:nuclease-related domain-containing protein n=1 Tax=Bacillus sp. JJ1532 TaxID=3122958 RepID=UPI002FFFFA7D
MIKKDRKKPITLRKLEALDRRITPAHPKKQLIADDLAKKRAGFRGEQALDYHLTFMPTENYHIFHSLRLQDHKMRFFQIDTLILTQKFHLILETKNFSGTLFFDQEFHQLLRTNQNESKAYSDPITQANRQTRQLRLWLNSHRFPSAPIIPFVVISSPSTTIQTNPQYSHLLRNVIHSAALPFKVEEIEKKHKSNLLTKKELNAISRLLLKKHVPFNQDILAKFQIGKEEIVTGVYCNSCLLFSMRREWGTWKCTRCNKADPAAHLQALEDYALLFGPTITNLELRTFLGIESESVARKILTSTCPESFGEKKNRGYIIPMWLD